MAVNPLNIWKSSLAALPKTTDSSWATNFASWYSSQILGIQPNPAALVDAGFSFIFNEATFASQLATLAPTTDAIAGAQGFADAWEAALLSSTAISLPGAFIPPTSPPTLFSVVASTVIDPPSIAAAKAKLLELATAPPESDPLQSVFPTIFRDATLLLTITVTGLDSTPTPSGPLPLVAAAVSLI